MRIKSKVNLLVLATVAILLMGLMAGLYFIGIEGLLDIEKHEAIEDSAGAEKYLYTKISSIDRTDRDWAFWNSTYFFMDGKDPDYISENMLEGSFENLELNAILYFDLNGELFFGRYYDFQSGGFAEIPKSLIEEVSDVDFVKNPNEQSGGFGFLNTEDELYAVSINPVLTNSEEGPAKGTLAMAKLVTDEFVSEISDEIDISVEVTAQKSFADSFLNNLHSGSKRIIIEKDKNLISVITPFYDIKGEPVGEFRITERRELFNMGLRSVYLNLLFALVTCVVIILLMNYFIDSIIVRRLEHFSSELERIAKDRDYSARLDDGGDDEISSITNSANALLETIQKSLESLEMKNRELNRTLSKKSELIGELHHRVKNNLQYIISLIGIKSLKITDKNALEVMSEATNRIKYLGMIHDDLYNKDDKDSLLFKEHLSSLANLLLEGVSTELKEKISVEIKGDEFEAELSYAIPLSTAIYELLKNSADHAFDESGGKIEIVLSEESGIRRISISDNGRGIADSKNGQSGFGIITARAIIAKQLKGSLKSTDLKKGTGWLIEFCPQKLTEENTAESEFSEEKNE